MQGGAEKRRRVLREVGIWAGVKTAGVGRTIMSDLVSDRLGPPQLDPYLL